MVTPSNTATDEASATWPTALKCGAWRSPAVRPN